MAMLTKGEKRGLLLLLALLAAACILPYIVG